MALEYFNPNGFNCAESTMRLLQERGKIDIPGCMIPAMSGFGGGMTCGLTCGVVTAAVAALGLATGKKSPEDPREPSQEAVKEFLAAFNGKFGGVTCEYLTRDVEPKTPEMRALCRGYVEAAAALAEETLAGRPACCAK